MNYKQVKIKRGHLPEGNHLFQWITRCSDRINGRNKQVYFSRKNFN